MNDNEKWQLREQNVIPTGEVLKQVLDNSYAIYETFCDVLPDLNIDQEWQWYTPYKAWFARGQYQWMTPRGTKKEKTLYWLYVYDEYFSVAIWFKEKNRMEIINSNVSEKVKHMILDAKTMGNMPTFPVIFNIVTAEQLADIYELINCKKRLER